MIKLKKSNSNENKSTAVTTIRDEIIYDSDSSISNDSEQSQEEKISTNNQNKKSIRSNSASPKIKNTSKSFGV